METAYQKRRKVTAYSTCVWCGERKPIAEMRHPASTRGKTPSTCHACREAHPTEGWCDDHDRPEAIERFSVDRSRPIGRMNICKDSVAYRAAQKRAKPQRRCVSCGELRDSWFFRGGNNKRITCRDCEVDHPDERWCLDCAAWLPADDFYRTGRRDGGFTEARCKPCGVTNSHGVTRAHMVALTGLIEPRCGACGSTRSLKIDHDHGHCPSQRGCVECVRGYLCHSCNASEGLLRTSDRARLLAVYMEAHGL